MKRVPAKFAAAIAASSAVILITGFPVLADANPNNHGHHYGQLKHRAPAPAPSSLPKPAPQPSPVNLTPGVQSPRSAGVAQSSGGQVPSVAPPASAPIQIAGSVKGAQPQPSGGYLDWLLLIILPALALVWMVVAMRAALTASRRRWRSAPATQLGETRTRAAASVP